MNSTVIKSTTKNIKPGSPRSLKRTFSSYGLYPTKIINEKINQKQLKKHNCTASKNPKLFGIDLHIDDSKGVKMEGEKYGFETLIIELEDREWTAKVLENHLHPWRTIICFLADIIIENCLKSKSR